MQCVSVSCSWAGAGFASRLFKPVVDFRCGLVAAAAPNVVGDIHCTVSCLGIFYRPNSRL